MPPHGVLRVACLAALFCGAAAAELERIEIRGKDAIGPYERISGRAYFTVDPKAAVNRPIADIALAPKNAAGKVEFSSDLLVLRPPAGKSRGAVFLEVVNRGGPQSLGIMGDQFALDQGFTVAFLGWQFDVPPGNGLALEAPTAPITGLVRQSYVEEGGGRHYTGFRLAYCAADREDQDARLTFRAAIEAPAQIVPREQWHFEHDGCAVTLNGGFDTGLYEAIYHAKNPAIAGLGLAAIRDFASYLKFGPKGAPLREDPASVQRVIGYGYSQSGRFLRQFVRDGFNEDEQGRAAFDGLMISSAGAGGGSFNHRFAMPGEAGNSVLSILRPVDLPPFTDDGLLAKAKAAHVIPLIFYTFTSTEYWARAGSLTHTSSDARTDVPLNPRSRLYFLAGTPHASGPFPPSRMSGAELQYANFAQQRWIDRALLLDLDAWVASGKDPPPSRYPTLARKELVPRAAVQFPKSLAIAFPEYMPQVWRMDYGPEFLTKGIIANEPPVLGEPYPILVPQVDADGNDLGGIRPPEVAAPLGTFTGWNIQLPQLAGLHYLSGLIGSFEAFPKTMDDQQRSHDARRSIADRYAGRQDYMDHVRQAAQQLTRERFMLPDDVEAAVRKAGEMWDVIVKGN